jgi:hypothetical protein
MAVPGGPAGAGPLAPVRSTGCPAAVTSTKRRGGGASSGAAAGPIVGLLDDEAGIPSGQPSQHPRISSPVSGWRRESSPQ